MAKKTYKVEVSSAVKRQALEALLVALGFDKAGPDAYVEAKKTPVKKNTSKAAKPAAKKTTSTSVKQKPTR
ncbi:hypothetical protein [Spirosoma areae]